MKKTGVNQSEERLDQVLATDGRRAFLQKGGTAALAVGGAMLGLLDAPVASADTPDAGSVVSSLPAEVRKYYDMATTTPLGPSIYRDFKPKRPMPWLIGYSSSFGGNTWRIGARTRLQETLVPKY